MDDPYKVLGVEVGADEDHIRKAYRRLAQHHHPDTSGPRRGQAAATEQSLQRMAALNDAWAILGDPARRAAYDATTAAAAAAAAARKSKRGVEDYQPRRRGETF